jgi:3-phenylpropionate/trans-cinnamate dioxygenase ferredoxin subunit
MAINIKVRDNGPYLVEGEFTMTDAQGNPIDVKKAALCRCGGSTMKPFCDGTHSKIGFKGANEAVQSADPGAQSSGGSSST